LSTIIQDWLKSWFVARGKIGKDAVAFAGDTDFFEAGWLTSMEVVELVTEIESRFDMQFSEADLQDSRFVTIPGLADLIVERLNAPDKNLNSDIARPA